MLKFTLRQWSETLRKSCRRVSTRRSQLSLFRSDPQWIAVESLETRALLTDFGDAPLPYPVTTLENGARHTEAGPTLGATRDGEANGAHSATANGDGADDNGVTFGTMMVGALSATVTVSVTGSAGKLDAWIDFNGDGSWGGPGEQIFASQNVIVGTNNLTLDVPVYAIVGKTYARFRLSTAGGLGPQGTTSDGEVEDYQVTISNPVATVGLFGVQQEIGTTASSPRALFAIDIDGDGDLDALSASGYDDRIAWYENDGDGNFTQHTISTAADFAISVFGADVDGDGDTDVLSASLLDFEVAWYENDGRQNFTQHTITTVANNASSVFAADVDSDGDIDVLSAARDGNNIAWYENDGSENFTPHTISSSAQGAYSVFAADLDGDGDMDVLSASYLDDKVAWYENDGNENFIPHLISAADGARAVFASDVDGDGDIDVLSASQYDDRIAWYENDGSANFTPHTISTTADGAWAVSAADMDGDGDMDVLSASTIDDKIAWYRNDGSENFTPRSISVNVDSARSVFPGDVDGDGDLDVFSVSPSSSTKIAWYENQGPGPIIGSFDTSVTYTEHALPVLIDENVTVMDADSVDLATGTLTVAITSNSETSDRIGIRHVGNMAGQIGVSGNTVKYGNLEIGTYSGTTTLIVTLNANATPTAAQALLRSVTFASISDNPSTLSRTVKVTLTDGDGGTSNSPTKTVKVTATNVTLSVSPATIAENGGLATFKATLSSPAPAGGVTVTLGFSGTATDPADYTKSGTQIVIAAGATEGTLTVTGVADAVVDPDENVTVTITAAPGATIAGTPVTVTISEALPTAPLDIDGSGGSANGQSDGLMVFAILGGADNDDVLNALKLGSLSPQQIKGKVAALGNALDVDGNGAVSGQSDGLLIFAILGGSDSDAVINLLKLGNRSPQQIRDAVSALKNLPVTPFSVGKSVSVISAVGTRSASAVGIPSVKLSPDLFRIDDFFERFEDDPSVLEV